MEQKNYRVWGTEYLVQAAALKARLDQLREQVPHLIGDAAMTMKNRISLLYDMYLECRATGLLLQSREKGAEYEQKTCL